MLGEKSLFIAALGLAFSVTAAASAAEEAPPAPPTAPTNPSPAEETAPAPEGPPAEPGAAPEAPAPSPETPAPPATQPPGAEFGDPPSNTLPPEPSEPVPAAPHTGGAGFVPASPAQPATPQPAPAAPPPGATAGAPAVVAAPEPSAPPEADTTSAEEDDEDGPIGWAGIGVKIGYQYFGDASFDSGEDAASTVVGGIPARKNTTVALTIDLGGDGFGVQLSPFYASGELRDEKLSTVGLFAGGMYRPHFGKVYPHVGVGLQAGFMSADIIDVGLDFYARIPVGFTYYPLKNLGLVAELGLGYGVTGVQYPTQSFDVGDGSISVSSPDLEFGTTFLYDLSIGLRFP